MKPRKIHALLVAALTILSLAGVQTVAQADPPSRQLTITESDSSEDWTGDTASGANQEYDAASGEPCVDGDGVGDPTTYCDKTLVNVDVPANFWATKSGGLEVRLDNYKPNPTSDFDLYIYKSDAAGNRGAFVNSSPGLPAAHENTTVPEARGYYLIQVVYFAVTTSNYDGHIELFFRDRKPRDVDVPPGLQEILASNARAGWKSRSEPHIAVNPLNPNMLVAGSKFYNKDPDSLAEYEFKVGTYVSFNGGRTWSDLGQLKTCPRNQAPKSSWPNNTCYPADNPSQGGTGLEDAIGGPGVTINQEPANSPLNQGEHIVGTEFSDSRPLANGSVGPAQIFLADDEDGCAWTTAVASGEDPWIGLAYRTKSGSCPTFQNKFNAATAAGADGLIVINTDDETPPPEGTAVAEIPGILIKLSDGERLAAAVEAGEVIGTLQVPRGPDFGEEYITSDPWFQWDDEGNAYAMVLDSPPFDSGVGWGMTMHKWESVSPADVSSGNTWSDRHPINAYPDGLTRDFFGFLDDKNTFAVNNAGDDNEAEGAQSNIMIACWGQNVSLAIKQQEVCERSPPVAGTGNGVMGEDWSGEPVEASSVHQLVIGVHVVADKTLPETFYLAYLQYESTLATSQATLEFGRTDDGGLTWTSSAAPVVVDVFDDIPRQFPRQGFRNLSIPIMAVGPDLDGVGTGDPPALYIAISEYMPAPNPDEDEDGMQADIILYKSVDGGLNWTEQNVTEGVGPNTNADQFQPVVEVTESGQINVSYFDRRHDIKTETHPGNYFVDTYLSRSNDGGESWSHHRLSHDSTDPEFNAPISGSGKFFGDYQGLVADDCVAIPFVNDTHLANDQFLDPGPIRDPNFDTDGRRSLPDIRYQQAINWRVPNSSEFGGNGMPDLHPRKITVEKVPRRGRPNLLASNIANLECIDAQNVRVRFLDNGVPIGDRIIPLIRGNGRKSATIPWTPQTAGPHEITVIADPNNEIEETEEGNNTFTRTYNVRS